MQARDQPKYERVEVESKYHPYFCNKKLSLTHILVSLSSESEFDLLLQPTPPQDVVYLIPEEEIAYGPACYLWDYLRRVSPKYQNLILLLLVPVS
jgi:NAD+ synthase (glutamine-hydrolysing)